MTQSNPYNVLSLFDGKSCGRVALHRAGIRVDNYYASEIDKYAIQISKKNFPDTIYLGTVTDHDKWDLPKIDLIMAGSPCQGFSFAGKQLNFDDPRSALFWEFIEILKKVKRENPDVKFILENVRMKKEYLKVITDAVKVEPILINSALVSAQNRQRYYWTNIPDVKQPKDLGIMLEDVLEESSEMIHMLSGKALARMARKKYSSPKILPHKTGTLNTKNNSGQLSMDSGTTLIPVIKSHGKLVYKPNKSQCLDANYFKGPDNHGQRTFILLDKHSSKNGLICLGGVEKNKWPDQGIVKNLQRNIRQGNRVYSDKGKSPCLNANSGNTASGSVLLGIDKSHWRKLTPIECERLQTLPDNYTEGVSNSQRYKMIGNGWTVDVISHILKNIDKPIAPLFIEDMQLKLF